MLTASQQANILQKAGIAVPAFPARKLPVQERYLRPGARIPQRELDADAEQRRAVEAWSSAVSNLYVSFVASRSAKPLRLAPEARSSARLRHQNLQPSSTTCT
jgi:hypothetical protein